MSLLRLKQIAGPADSKAGSVIVFDNNKAQWSTDLSSSIKLPSGTTAQRPSAAEAGMIRFNSTTGKIEAFESSTWKNIAVTTFAELTDGPGPLQAGKGMRVNSAGSGLEFFTLANGLTRYRFQVTFAGQEISAITGLPAGWTYELQSSNTAIKLIHNLGVLPTFTVSYGRTSTSNPNLFTQRITGATAAGGIGMTYDASNMNFCTITSVTANSTSSAASGIAYLDVYFLII